MRFTSQNRGKFLKNSGEVDLESHEEEVDKGKSSKTNTRAGRKRRDSESSSLSASSSSATKKTVAGQEPRGKGLRVSTQNGRKVLTKTGEAVGKYPKEEGDKGEITNPLYRSLKRNGSRRVMNQDDEDASTSDLDPSNHSTLASDLDPPPRPHMRQAPPLREGRSSVGDEDTTSAQ